MRDLLCAVRKEENFLLGPINSLTRKGDESLKNLFNHVIILLVSSSRKGKVIYKEEVRKFTAFSTDCNGRPVHGTDLIILRGRSSMQRMKR